MVLVLGHHQLQPVGLCLFYLLRLVSGRTVAGVLRSYGLCRALPVEVRRTSRGGVAHQPAQRPAALLFGYFFDEYTPAAATYWDAFTTVFSVIATLILVRKVLDNWAYWIVTDLIYIGLYFSRGAYLFALVMVVYVFIFAFALVSWARQYRMG